MSPDIVKYNARWLQAWTGKEVDRLLTLLCADNRLQRSAGSRRASRSRTAPCVFDEAFCRNAADAL